ncbi:hypothetical protein DPMN_118873 [Dreissena polymorpha]|uniref:Uncharacterized protein n=1 Tax=Dreissena polymorpha TaxID=45954 RepID=A0A9D4JMA8_DREPO|nr:hypothetical protein DPMN_118873 [Dreissena polymorpha]
MEQLTINTSLTCQLRNNRPSIHSSPVYKRTTGNQCLPHLSTKYFEQLTINTFLMCHKMEQLATETFLMCHKRNNCKSIPSSPVIIRTTNIQCLLRLSFMEQLTINTFLTCQPMKLLTINAYMYLTCQQWNN